MIIINFTTVYKLNNDDNINFTTLYDMMIINFTTVYDKLNNDNNKLYNSKRFRFNFAG